jgi:anaerobic selenocysteine-containing dehydrogenase
VPEHPEEFAGSPEAILQPGEKSPTEIRPGHRAAGLDGETRLSRLSGMAQPPWKPTACILCECNCGLEVQLGGDGGRHLTKIRGDEAHPASQGYACESRTCSTTTSTGRTA